MPKAVRFEEYGGLDVLKVVEVQAPTPGPEQLLVRVKAAAINPGEVKIREGALHERWPATFPSGEGTDLAGVVEAVGGDVVRFSAGDEVIAYTHERASHAELVLVDESAATAKPAKVSWEAGGSLAVAATTAVAAVRAVSPSEGETVVVSGAGGGVGTIAVQLARRTGAAVIGLASPRDHDWLRAHDVAAVDYHGQDLAERIRAANGGENPDAFIDCVGSGYVELASQELGIPANRIDTIADFQAAAQYGAQTKGSVDATDGETLATLADLIARGELEVPIAATFPLEEVKSAFTELAEGHPRGKIVLIP